MSCDKIDYCINFPGKCGLCRYSTNSNLDFYEEEKVSKSKKKGNINYKRGIRAEQEVARRYGGDVIKASGALSSIAPSLSGDVVFKDCGVLAQVKTKVKRGEKQDEIVIQKNWLQSHWAKALVARYTPILIFSFFNNDKFWCIKDTPEEDLLLTMIWTCTGGESVRIKREMLVESHNEMNIVFKDWEHFYSIELLDTYLEKLRNG